MNPAAPPVEAENAAPADYLLLVATPMEERQLLEAAQAIGILEPKRKIRVPWDRRLREYYELGRLGSNSINAIRIDMGPHGFRGSASSALRWRAVFRSQAIVCVGTAFGLSRTSQALGDVLVSRALLPYDNRDVRCAHPPPSPNAAWWKPWIPWRQTLASIPPRAIYSYPRLKAYPSNEPLFRLFERHSNLRPRGHRVHFGSMLTGGCRIMCGEYRDELASQAYAAVTASAESPMTVAVVVGGEMEGAGLLAGCREDDPNWIIVKGISDFGDLKDPEPQLERSLVAARNAAEFVLAAFRDDVVA